jgi:multidrug resistance protein, MATE family
VLVLGNFRRELQPIRALALPLIVAEVGWMAMSIVDTIMVGRLPESAVAIGAVSLGSILFYTGAIFAGAMLFGLDTVVSQAFGGRMLDDCHHALWNALYLCAALAPAAIGINAVVAGMLPRFGVNEAVVPGAASYIRIMNWGVVPLLLSPFGATCRPWVWPSR